MNANVEALVVNNCDEFLGTSSNVFGTIIEKLNGEQITSIALNTLKYGTICFVAYVCGADGLKALTKELK